MMSQATPHPFSAIAGAWIVVYSPASADVYAPAFNIRHVVVPTFLGRYPWMSMGIELPNVGG